MLLIWSIVVVSFENPVQKGSESVLEHHTFCRAVALEALLVALGHKGDCEETVQRLVACDGSVEAIGRLLAGRMFFLGELANTAFAILLAEESKFVSDGHFEVTSGDLWDVLIPIVRAVQPQVAVQWNRLQSVLEHHVAAHRARLAPQAEHHSPGHRSNETKVVREVART